MFKFFCFCVSRYTHAFGEQLFILRRCRERLLALVTQCAKRDGREINCFFRCSHCRMSLVLRFAKSNIHILSSCLFVCSGFLNCFFCFVFQEILYGFSEEFDSFHVRRCRERLSVVVTRCATRNGREKK